MQFRKHSEDLLASGNIGWACATHMQHTEFSKLFIKINCNQADISFVRLRWQNIGLSCDWNQPIREYVFHPMNNNVYIYVTCCALAFK